MENWGTDAPGMLGIGMLVEYMLTHGMHEYTFEQKLPYALVLGANARRMMREVLDENAYVDPDLRAKYRGYFDQGSRFLGIHVDGAMEGRAANQVCLVRCTQRTVTECTESLVHTLEPWLMTCPGTGARFRWHWSFVEGTCSVTTALGTFPEVHTPSAAVVHGTHRHDRWSNPLAGGQGTADCVSGRLNMLASIRPEPQAGGGRGYSAGGAGGFGPQQQLIYISAVRYTDPVELLWRFDFDERDS